MAEEIALSDRFRAGVGIVIVDSRGRVLSFRRRGFDTWQLPQGGIDAGEDAAAATARELREETGLDLDALTHVETLPVWLGYELPVDAQSRKTGRGQVHRWTICMASDPASVLPDVDGKEFDAWDWMSFEELVNRTISFRRDVYRMLASHVTQYLAPS